MAEQQTHTAQPQQKNKKYNNNNGNNKQTSRAKQSKPASQQNDRTEKNNSNKKKKKRNISFMRVTFKYMSSEHNEPSTARASTNIIANIDLFMEIFCTCTRIVRTATHVKNPTECIQMLAVCVQKLFTWTAASPTLPLSYCTLWHAWFLLCFLSRHISTQQQLSATIFLHLIFLFWNPVSPPFAPSLSIIVLYISSACEIHRIEISHQVLCQSKKRNRKVQITLYKCLLCSD